MGVGSEVYIPVSIARQQWRARIETLATSDNEPITDASPASNGGRGLKLERYLRLAGAPMRIAR